MKPVTLPPEMVAVAVAVSPTNELLSLPSFVMSNAVPPADNASLKVSSVLSLTNTAVLSARVPPL